MPQIGGVVTILIPGRNHHDPEPDDVFQTVQDFRGIARIVKARRQKTCKIRAALNFPQKRQTRVRTHIRPIEIYQNGLAVQG